MYIAPQEKPGSSATTSQPPPSSQSSKGTQPIKSSRVDVRLESQPNTIQPSYPTEEAVRDSSQLITVNVATDNAQYPGYNAANSGTYVNNGYDSSFPPTQPYYGENAYIPADGSTYPQPYLQVPYPNAPNGYQPYSYAPQPVSYDYQQPYTQSYQYNYQQPPDPYSSAMNPAYAPQQQQVLCPACNTKLFVPQGSDVFRCPCGQVLQAPGSQPSTYTKKSKKSKKSKSTNNANAVGAGLAIGAGVAGVALLGALLTSRH